MAKYNWYKDNSAERYRKASFSDFPKDFIDALSEDSTAGIEKDCLLWNDDNYLNKVKVEIGKNDIYLEVNGEKTFVDWNPELVPAEQLKHIIEICLDNVKEGQKLSGSEFTTNLKDGIYYYEKNKFKDQPEDVWFRNFKEEKLCHSFGDIKVEFTLSSNTSLEYIHEMDEKLNFNGGYIKLTAFDDDDHIKKVVERICEDLNKVQNLNTDYIDYYMTSKKVNDYINEGRPLNQTAIEADYKYVWETHNMIDYSIEFLNHTFKNDPTVEFKVKPDKYFDPPKPIIVVTKKDPFSYFDINVDGDFSDAKKIVEKTVDHFDQKQSFNFKELETYLMPHVLQKETKIGDVKQISHHIEAHVEQQEKEIQEKELTKKTGYVQGVCECVLAIGDDHFSAKKLLTKMNVTKEMAKKYANPETYKSLEKGIFAEQQKIEQTHTIKR